MIFSQAKLQVGRPKFHLNSNLDLGEIISFLYDDEPFRMFTIILDRVLAGCLAED